MKQRRALGRGLGALIPGGGGDEPAPVEGLKKVRIDLVRANPLQPRKQFDEDDLDELSASISDVGLMQPIVVRPQGDGYEIISGERRWRAAQRSGLEEIPIVIRDAGDREVLALSLIENLQRVDLNPMEEAEGYRRLAEDFGLTQEEVAKSVGKDRTTVTNLLRLLKLAPGVQAMVREGVLSMGHGRALAALADPTRQLSLAKQVVAKDLSVRQIEALARGADEPAEKAGKSKITDPNLRDVIDRLRRSFGTKVVFSGKADKGKIAFEYYSSEEFDRLLEKLLS